MGVDQISVADQEKVRFPCRSTKARITEINVELDQLDRDFKADRIFGDDYVQKRQTLKQIIDSFKEELSRMGIIPTQNIKISDS